MDPLILTILISCGIFFVAFKIGEGYGEGTRNQTIEETIKYLIDEGYLRSTVNQDGELEIIPLDKK